MPKALNLIVHSSNEDGLENDELASLTVMLRRELLENDILDPVHGTPPDEPEAAKGLGQPRDVSRQDHVGSRSARNGHSTRLGDQE
jgi:hypothetical protein